MPYITTQASTPPEAPSWGPWDLGLATPTFSDLGLLSWTWASRINGILYDFMGISWGYHDFVGIIDDNWYFVGIIETNWDRTPIQKDDFHPKIEQNLSVSGSWGLACVAPMWLGGASRIHHQAWPLTGQCLRLRQSSKMVEVPKIIKDLLFDARPDQFRGFIDIFFLNSHSQMGMGQYL
jgi:hypothetical protein